MNVKRYAYLFATTLFVVCCAAVAEAQKPELVVQAGHASPVRAVAFSPDGRLLVSGSGGTGFALLEVSVVKLWDAATGTELRTLAPDGAAVWVAFSRDGARVAAMAKTVKVWDVKTGAELVGVQPDAGYVTRVASPDGKVVAESSLFSDDSKVVKLCDRATGSELRTLVHDGPVFRVEFTADSRQVKTLLKHGIVKTWDAASGAELRGEKPNMDLASRAVSFDGGAIAEADGKNIRLRDAATGRERLMLASRTSDFQKVLFSPDSSILATGGERFSTRLWDLRSGVLRTLEGHTDYPVSAAFSPDSRLFASGGRDLSVRLWDVASGRELRKLTGHTEKFIQLIRFSPDGKTFFSADKESLKLWDAATGRELLDVKGSFIPEARWADFSPRGDLLAARVRGEGIKLWATATGREVRALPGAGGDIHFTSDGKRLLAKEFNKVELWDVEGGKLISSFHVPPGEERDSVNYMRAAVSPDSRVFAVAEYDTRDDKIGNYIWRLYLHDMETGKRLRTVEVGGVGDRGKATNPLDPYGSIIFSADGKQIINAGSNNWVAWDAATGARLSAGEKPVKASSPDESRREEFRERWKIAPHYFSLDDYSQHSPNGVYFVSFGLNGELRLIETNTWREVASLIGIDDRDWLVATPEGFFDGSPASWQRILWRFDNDTFNHAPVEAFFNDFYYPGLLRDVLAGKPPAPPEGKELARIDRRQPKVSLTQVAARGGGGRMVTIAVEVEENAEKPSRADHATTSGARDVRLFRNGSLVKLWRGDVLKGRRRVTLEAMVPVIAGANRFTAYAFNRDNVKSADASLSVTGAEALRRKGTAYVIAVGVNAYSNAAFDLKYAVADADAFAAEFKNQQNHLGLFERVETIALRDREATKQNILEALAGVAARAQPEDAVAFYFAGHGKAHRGQFYLLPHDLGYAGDRTAFDEAAQGAMLAHGVSDRELERVFERLDAGQLLMVIDACESGQALGEEGERRGPMNSKGLAQLAYEKGMYILTAAQSFQAAQEVSKLGHGLLTYALVEEGLRRGAGDAEPKDGEVHLREWLDYATRRVPEMRVEEVSRSMSRGTPLSFEDDQRALTVSARSGQQPRVFYRRENEGKPLLVARPTVAP